jgi:quinol monooxygenase YgiN
MIGRRAVLAGMGAALAGCSHGMALQGQVSMYGLIGSMTATRDNRETLTRHLLTGLRDMPGCLSYIVAQDPGDPDKLWITEVWDSAGSHIASLRLPQVQAAIAAARPLIAGMGDRQETVPLGGVGLPRRS